MVEVNPVKDGPDFNGQVEVNLQSFALEEWGCGNKGAAFILEPQAARQLFGKLGDALRVIEANEVPS